MHTFALWLHIIGAGLWLGTNVVQAVIGPKLGRDERAALPWFKAVESASGPIYGVAYLLLLGAGVYLVLSSDGTYTFGSAFVGIGFAVLIIGGALAGLVFNRKTKQMIGLLEQGETAQVAPIYRSLGTWGVLDTLLVLFAIWAMVAKW